MAGFKFDSVSSDISATTGLVSINGVIVPVDSGLVHTTGDESISGIKTFNSETVFNDQISAPAAIISNAIIDTINSNTVLTVNAGTDLTVNATSGAVSISTTEWHISASAASSSLSATALAFSSTSGSISVTSAGQLSLVTSTGVLVTGKLTTQTSGSGSASLRMPHGTAPSSPANGDLWTTTSGIFVQINGSTVGPLSAGGGGTPGGADTQVQFNNSGSFGGSASLTWDGSTLTTDGLHATGTVTLDGTLDVTGQISAFDSSTNYKAAIGIENNDPRLLFIEDDASANNKAWILGISGSVFNIWAANDSIGPTLNPALAFARSGATPTTITSTAEIITPASTTTRSGLSLPHGSAPSSPTDGDLWTTTSGIFVRINGSTVGPLGSAGAAGSDTYVQFNDGGNFGGEADFTWNKTTNTLTIGNSSGTGTVIAPGSIDIRSSAVAGNGQDAQVIAADGTTDAGGSAHLYSGNSVDGIGGSTDILGGSSTNGDGGWVTINAGDSTSTVGGSIQITAGGGVTPGDFIVRAAGDEQLKIRGAEGAWEVNGDHGTTGQLLTSNGTSGPPTWTTATLDSLSDVVITSVADKDFLVYDNGSTHWVNKTRATADVGYLTVPQNIQNGDYTLALTDAGKHIYKTSGTGAETITIPANGSIAFPVGSVVTIVNRSGDVVSIDITSDTLQLAGGTDTATPRTLADGGMVTILKVETTVWMISGAGVS